MSRSTVWLVEREPKEADVQQLRTRFVISVIKIAQGSAQLKEYPEYGDLLSAARVARKRRVQWLNSGRDFVVVAKENSVLWNQVQREATEFGYVVKRLGR